MKLGEALFNLVKRGFPFPRFWAQFARKPHPRSLSRRCRCRLRTENPSISITSNRYECARSYREYGSIILILKYRASSNPQNGISFTWFPKKFGNFQFAPGEGCGVELRQQLPPLTACFTLVTAKPGTNRTFQFVKFFWDWLDETIHRAKSQNRTQEKLTRHDKCHSQSSVRRFWLLVEVGSCHST